MMKRFYIITLVLLSVALILSCGTTRKLTQPVQTDTLGLAFGTDSTFDIITWNIENFPLAGNQTIDALTDILPALKADCIAIQEVTDAYRLSQMVSYFPGWKSITTPLYYGQGMAFIYDSTKVQVTNSYSIYTDQSSPFPRSPLVCELLWQNQQIYVIVNHLKAMGDNVIDYNDPDDDEMRRLAACQLLDSYITTNLPDQKVIVLGDLNDQIQEPPSTNVFMTFINKPAEYLFTDMNIAQHLTQQNCSYPYTSHIDHILITNELFSAFEGSGSYVRTLPIENFINGGLQIYKTVISDHRPVGARFNFPLSLRN